MSDSQDKLENGTFLDRLKVEKAELATRKAKLEAFIDTPPFYLLSNEERIDLRSQLTYMDRYLGILVRRLNRLVDNN